VTNPLEEDMGLTFTVMQVNHVRKCQAQYCSNVAMKVNAKLGGASCKVFAPKPFFTRPTMIIGADVSHAGPGSDQPSVAALTMSFDTVASRYAAAVQTNGYRVEMITETNINNMMMPLFNQWTKRVNGDNGKF
jgi:eukaryotic translation initiation factor 2C